MDTPLLPEKNEQPDRRELQPRYVPRPEVLRTIAGMIALVGALIGLISRLEAKAPVAPPAPPPQVLPAIVHTVYGVPALSALRPAANATDRNRTVCSDQIRTKRQRAWRCSSVRWLSLDEIGAQAFDPGGPCTHRMANASTGKWVCMTRMNIPPANLHLKAKFHFFFWGITVEGNGVDQPRKPIVCFAETRMNGPSSPWRCDMWRPRTPGVHFLPPAVDRTDRCTSRFVDQETGIWSCQVPPAD